MKRFCLILALFTVSLAVSCGDPVKFEDSPEGHSQTDEPQETGTLGGECYENQTCNPGLICDEESNTCMKEPENPTDTGDTEPTDTGDTEPTDTGDTEPTDTGDTEPTDTGDTEPTDTGDTTEPTDTGDTEPTDTGDTEPTDTGDTEPTDTGDTDPADTGDTDPASEDEICAEAGGIYDYFAEEEFEKCYKIVDCAPKPANTEWRGDQSYTEYYDLDEGYWTHFGLNYSTEYGDTGEQKVCQFICAAGYDWNGDVCTNGALTIGNICTGQTSCYNASSSMTCPSSSSADFYGQDAQYTNKCTPQSFSSSTNVVEDNNTGLTWEKSPSSSSYTWDNRATHCNELNSSNYGGRSDWRVPTSLEILTIVDNQKNASAVNSIFSGIPGSGSFWTAEQYSSDQGRRFGTNTGFIGYNSKTGTYNKVLCVSGDEMQKGVFTTQTVSGSVVVTDSTTGLMWQKTYEADKTWQQALKYCEDLTYAGYSDWRLPNKNELASLLNLDKSAAPYSDFPNMPSDWFWSSSTYILYTDNAWDVGFYYGLVGYYYKTKSHSVRCVR